MSRLAAFSLGLLSLALGAAAADDGRGLKRSANPSDITISGLSSGAAMAVQYAVAHSSSVVGVGSIAGPAWGCAEGSLSRAVNDCMCGRHAVKPKASLAHQLATRGRIDSLPAGKPQTLRRAYVFHSPADVTVREPSGQANVAFLTALIGSRPEVDHGSPSDGSDHAGHGIIAPDPGNEPCQLSGSEATYVRHCGAEDNAGKLFHALFDPGSAFDPSKRVSHIPESEVWEFDQQHLIDQVKAEAAPVAPDYFLFALPEASPRRQNFDMAGRGYIYVPPSCRQGGSACRVHIALHGCKQNPHAFATRAGYNNWAEPYKVIVVYPALEPSTPLPEGVCELPPISGVADSSLVEPNLNSCWDWWGYLDRLDQKERYLTREAPQMRVIGRLIAEITAAP